MQKKTFKIAVILSFLFSFNEVQSQISAAIYGNSSDTKIGLGYDFNEKFWSELRLYSGTSIEHTTAELVLNYNVIRAVKYKAYFGGGIIANRLNGLITPVGVRFAPLENFSNFSIQLELQPMYEIDYDNIFLSAFAGIRYKFD